MMTRIISSIVAFAIAAIVLILHDTIVFNIAISFFSVIIIYEVFTAQNCMQYKLTSAICLILTGLLPFTYNDFFAPYRTLILLLSVFAIFITYIINHKSLMFDKLCVMLASSLLVILGMCSFFNVLKLDKIHGLFLLVVSLCGAWFSDTGAYFAGTFFGKHKLCPPISPKKTVEGLIGGIISSALLFMLSGFVYFKIMEYNNTIVSINYINLAILGACCALVGLLGDLSASLLKRQSQIKDFGNIMPGHGGVLDRFDSILFVVPFMSFALKYISII